ncbi:ABC transporter permease [Brevibacterium yomogidense]|uniref:ABC transporter permease n=1 Tax=Brevibacterium yomogidense TaxID=946573 RepID=UPI0018E032D8|nr:ABC transporter permease [Brevibacterium yomogidense]
MRSGAKDVGDLNLFDFLSGFALIVLAGLVPTVGGVPTQELLIGVLVFIAFFRTPAHQLRVTRNLVPVFAGGFIFIAIVSATAVSTPDASEWKMRLLRIAATTVYAYCLATDRINLKATVYGFAAALVLNVPANYVFGLAYSDSYGEFLTGFISDKNVAGLAYCVLGVLFFAYQKTRVSQGLAAAGAMGALYLTGSRTSMAAFAFAALWIVLSPKLPNIVKWALALGMFWVIEYIENNFAQAGAFEDRQGSDILRNRIDAASEIKVNEAPWYGNGLGEAYVYLDDRTWFFHNSFWTAQVEGGYPWLILVLLLTLFAMGRPFKSLMSRDQLVAQALAVAILLCASRLGEVFFTLFWGLAMAYAMQSERTDAGLVKRMEEEGSDLRPLATQPARSKKRGGGQSIKS